MTSVKNLPVSAESLTQCFFYHCNIKNSIDASAPTPERRRIKHYFLTVFNTYRIPDFFYDFRHTFIISKKNIISCHTRWLKYSLIKTETRSSFFRKSPASRKPYIRLLILQSKDLQFFIGAWSETVKSDRLVRYSVPCSNSCLIRALYKVRWLTVTCYIYLCRKVRLPVLFCSPFNNRYT